MRSFATPLRSHTPVRDPAPDARRSLAATIAACLALGAFAGCSADAATLGPEATGAHRFAIVDVRVSAAGAPAPGTIVDASARFISVHEPGTPDTARSLLGLAWREIPVGTCEVVREESDAPTAASARVDLIDATPVMLTLRDANEQARTLPLDARAFPDVAGLASGVVFVSAGGAGRSAEAAPRALDVSAGGAPLGTFALPELPADLSVNAFVQADGRLAVGHVGLDVNGGTTRDGDHVGVDIVRGGVVRSRCSVDPRSALHLDGETLGGVGEALLVLRVQRRVLSESPAFGTVEARLARQTEYRLDVR